jgi:uncharacterized repeat protein (TIGR03803 family)
MQSQAQRLISLFRAIVLAGVSAFLITSAASPMSAQNTVPASAAQAARMPQFAARLADPTSRPASPRNPNPTLVSQGSRNGPGQGSGVIYENGPINGNAYAWTINFGFVVSDTFTTGGGGVTGMSFGAWLTPGDTLTSAELSITSEPNGGSVYFDQTVSFSQGTCTSNQYGYNVCTETSGNLTSPSLQPGTYWVNLQNASIPSGNPVYWDQNSGVGCMSPGCPSQAQEDTIGTIPSEAFTMLGNSNPPPQCFESHGNLQIISNFTQQQAGTNGQDGVVIDQAGNLYGAFPNGGDNSAGFVFKLKNVGTWLLDPIYSFLGGSNGSQPTGLMLGPNGTLYGGAQGGVQNCGTNGSLYCGLVFNLTPPPTNCRTALCPWNENVPYRFSSETDGSGTINVTAFDQQGNLYGTTSTGGTYDGGTVFELTPSGRGWTKTTLYSFSQGIDTGPAQVLVGSDGNLYGISNGYANGAYGVLFELTPSNGQWTESILQFFDYGGPHYLEQDSHGNLYGILPYGAIFAALNSDFDPGVITWQVTYPSGPLNNLTVDASGNMYGTGANNQSGYVYPFIFKAWIKNFGWYVEDLDYFGYQYFPAGGTLAFDPASGNLYGTTSACGTYNSGTVWQLSP